MDDAEDLELVMPMYNMIECNSNHSERTGSLWFYSQDEATNFNADIANHNFQSFEYFKNIKVTFGDHLTCHWLIAELN